MRKEKGKFFIASASEAKQQTNSPESKDLVNRPQVPAEKVRMSFGEGYAFFGSIIAAIVWIIGLIKGDFVWYFQIVEFETDVIRLLIVLCFVSAHFVGSFFLLFIIFELVKRSLKVN